MLFWPPLFPTKQNIHCPSQNLDMRLKTLLSPAMSTTNLKDILTFSISRYISPSFFQFDHFLLCHHQICWNSPKPDNYQKALYDPPVSDILALAMSGLFNNHSYTPDSTAKQDVSADLGGIACWKQAHLSSFGYSFKGSHRDIPAHYHPFCKFFLQL